MTLMRTSYEICRLLAVLSFLMQTGSRVSAQQKQSEKTECKFSLTHQAVKNLKPDELKAIIKSALEYRIDQCRNVHYDLEHRMGLCAFGEQIPSNFTRLITDERVQCWAIGYSFRVEKELRDRKLDNGITKYIRKDSYDAEAGVTKFFGMHPDGTSKNGVIDSKMTRSPFSDPYIYWMNMPDQHMFVGEFFVSKLVAHFNTWQLRVLPDGFVELTCDWSIALNRAAPGKITYVLDPIKGFLPTSCYGLWKNPNPKPKAVHTQFEMRFVVDDSKLVNGLWMPTKLRDAICSNGDHTKGSLHLQTVKTVELGNTKASDLRFPFPEGTKVQDRIKGTAFNVGPEEEEKKTRTLYITPPNDTLPVDKDKDQTAELRKTPNEMRWLYITLCNVVALSMLAFVIQRRVRSHRGAPKTQDAARIETGTDPGPAPQTGTNPPPASETGTN